MVNNAVDSAGITVLALIIQNRISDSKKSGDFQWVYNQIDKFPVMPEVKELIRAIATQVIEAFKIDEKIDFASVQMMIMEIIATQSAVQDAGKS